MIIPGTATLDHHGFRALFPALARWAWLDSPGSPPAAGPVADALMTTLRDWSTGDFDWKEWDAAPEVSRTHFAQLVRVPDDAVSLLGSVAEGVATVADSLPSGSVVVADQEYRSVLFPLAALDQNTHPLIRVTAEKGIVQADDLAAAIRPDTTLVAVSDTLTSNGNRVDLHALRRSTRDAGVRLLVDLTQSLGVLNHDLARLAADFTLVHGYKWLLSPRGAAWMVTQSDRIGELRPLLPSWKSTPRPHGYFGGPYNLPAVAGSLDTSPAWFSWLGSIAALNLLASLDRGHVEDHCVDLAQRWLAGAVDLGYAPVSTGNQSHIAVVDVGNRAVETQRRLVDAGVKASINGTRLRVGVHYFNNEDDIARCLDAMKK